MKIESVELKIMECEKFPEGHNERERLPGLEAQLAAVLWERLLLMQQLQGAMLLCVPRMSCVCCCSVYHTRVLADHSFRCDQLEAGEWLLLRKQLEGAMPPSLPSMICVSCRS